MRSNRALVMVLANDHSQRYIPPRSGVLTFEVKESFLNKKNYQIITSDEQRCIANMARHAGDVSIILAKFSNVIFARMM